MPTMPTREALRSEFDAAVQQIDQARSGSNLTSDFYARIGDSVFDAGFTRLWHFAVLSPRTELSHTATAHFSQTLALSPWTSKRAPLYRRARAWCAPGAASSVPEAALRPIRTRPAILTSQQVVFGSRAAPVGAWHPFLDNSFEPLKCFEDDLRHN
jgi:hypothetical protein